jgi:nucleotide-binding universal stress UspA family protein
MLPLKNILCPIDFSTDFQSALHLANELALFFSARITFVNVVPPPASTAWPADVYNIGMSDVTIDSTYGVERAEKELAEVVNEHISGDVQTSLRVSEGDPITEILSAAESINCNLIVMATHGRSRVSSAIFGSTTQRIVRQSECPVISLRAGQELDRTKQPLGVKEVEA